MKGSEDWVVWFGLVLLFLVWFQTREEESYCHSGVFYASKEFWLFVLFVACLIKKEMTCFFFLGLSLIVFSLSIFRFCFWVQIL